MICQLPESVRLRLDRYAREGGTAGLIGHGVFGRQVREYLQSRGMIVLIFDPPQQMREAEEEYEDTLEQWGNGMGGCITERTGGNVLYYPLKELVRRADFLCLQVPPEARAEVLASPELRTLTPETAVLDFSE